MKAYHVKHLLVGNELQLDNVYLVEDNKKIVEIVSMRPENIEVIDYSDKTVVPGLIDTHVHLCMDPINTFKERHVGELTLETVKNAKKHLQSGITFVRDVGAQDGVDFVVRDAINRGEVDGCQFLAAGAVICMTGGHGWTFGGRQCDGEDEVRKGTREQLRAGADLIKVMATGGVLTPGVEPGNPQLSFEELKVCCE